MSKKAIIVESPTKTRTLSRFLGKEYKLLASRGHVRDLPEKDLAVDVEHDYRPEYVIIPRQKKTISDLKKELKDVEEVYLASDPDREGEAIAWHLTQALKLDHPQRIEFNEITEEAVRNALQHPRQIDMHRVEAQQARRVLDRLVGYEISPLLWRMAKRGAGVSLSAGRVQSVALRLIVDREREILAFVPEEYWSITAQLSPQEKKQPFAAELKEKAGEKISLISEEQAQRALEELRQATWVVGATEEKTRKRNPQPAFITSTLQRAAASELNFSASKTMKLAQDLYEGVDLDGDTVGLITYMRTDSTRVAAPAQAQAREYIEQQWGGDHVGPGVRGKAVKGAQEAHECIRPTSVLRTPESLKHALERDAARLYELIWRRFLASQMAPAVYNQKSADIVAGDYLFRATASVLVFAGYQKVMPDKSEKPESMPLLREGQKLDLLELEPEQHFTQPPPRYNEASLVQALEENGIGRPSTYAPIIETLRQRKYVEINRRQFTPTRLGVAVCDYLVDHFPEIMDVEFTAGMEESLDTVEQGEKNWVELLRGFHESLEDRLGIVKGCEFSVLQDEKCPECEGNLLIRYSVRGKFAGCEKYPECKYTRDLSGLPPQEEPAELEEECPECGKPLVLRQSRRGPFIGCSAFPACRYVRSLPGDRPQPIKTDWPCEKCGKPLVLRSGRRGRFLGCSGFPRCRFTREATEAELQSLGVEESSAEPAAE